MRSRRALHTSLLGSALVGCAASQFPNPSAQAGDQAGFAVAVDGEWAIVGVPKSDTLSRNAGKALIYQRDGTKWPLRATATASTPSFGAQFGWSLDISGDRAIVGALGHRTVPTALAETTTPPELGDGWPTASPEAMGLDGARLAAMTAAVRGQDPANVHAVLIERDGRLVYEEYFAGPDQRWGRGDIGHVTFDRDTKHDLRSVTKSVTSALLGIALADSAAVLLDRPLVDFFPEHADLATSERRAVTLRHALTMTAGFDWNEELPYTDPRNDEIGMTRSDQPVRYALARPVVSTPGAQWRYNGSLTQLLAEVVQRLAGRPLLDYANAVLFAPLGITDVEWLGNLAGAPSAASGLRIRARDLAKFGSLYLNHRRWQGQQIVPAVWIEESTRPHVTLPADTTGPVAEEAYGFQWWIDRYPTPTGPVVAHAAMGNGQQRIFVLPELGMVVTVFAGRYNDRTAWGMPERLLTEHVLAAVRPR